MTTIDTSASDNRQVRHIKLDNKLEALLFHDPETTKAGAGLDVHVGCALDPKTRQGLAHFCEHMLFMGSEKYPGENEYNEHVQKSGGYDNAYTSLTSTNYQFEVSTEGFESTLDMFAQFFIKPLFNEGSVEREMKAVDSEN